MIRGRILSSVALNAKTCGCSKQFTSSSRVEFRPRKALILTKVTRYEYEKTRHTELSETEFEAALSKRGSDYAQIRFHHTVHKDTEESLIKTLEDRGIETRKVQRYAYSAEHQDWADVVVTAGGDGTFLLGAAKILNRDKPIIGINTDPTRSEGYLCLPKNYSFNLEKAFDKILKGEFSWLFRRRLRVTLQGDVSKIHEPPIELHSQQLKFPEYRYMDFLSEKSVHGKDHPFSSKDDVSLSSHRVASRVIPVLALNDIFVGESLSSRVSYLEVKFDNGAYFKTRNSGLCISTGTGSTSWTFNINKQTHHSVQALLKIINEMTDATVNYQDPQLVDEITKKFNNAIVFDPELDMMAYTLRDPVSVGTFPAVGESKPRGKVKRIEVQSRCFDACLVIDGSLSYRFNDGTRAIIEIYDEDALRTIQLQS